MNLTTTTPKQMQGRTLQPQILTVERKIREKERENTSSRKVVVFKV
jgi:hypothetical protein